MRRLGLGLFPLVIVVVGACGPDSPDGNAGTSSASSTASGPSEDSTADSPTQTSTTANEDTTASGGTTAAADSSGTTAGLDCMATEFPDCPLTTCLEQWEFDCSGCRGIRIPDGMCFGADIGCQRPRLVCADLPSPCDRVWAMGEGTVEQFEDEAAAVCMLQSLRDGVAGQYELLFGAMGDIGLVDIDVFTDGSGTVFMQYQDSCEGCPASGFFGRSGALEIQGTAFFDACLTAPNTASLADCLIGLPMFVSGDPPPADWAPPFTTGSCAALAWGCPAAP